MGGPVRMRERPNADRHDSPSARSQSAEQRQTQSAYAGPTHVADRSSVGEEVRLEREALPRRGLAHNFASVQVSTQRPDPMAHRHSGVLPAGGLPAISGRRQAGGISTDVQARFGPAAADVVIHADPAAAAAADRLQASAFALGKHVAFGTGRFDPASTRGRMLLAHEIAHVVQQRGTDQIRNPAAPATAHSARESELEANEAAANAIYGLPIPALTARPVAVACQGRDEESDWRKRLWAKGAALVEKAKVEARDYIKKQVGVVEGVATEAANLVDAVVWAEYAPGDIVNAAVDKMAAEGGLSKDKREALHEAVQTVTTSPVLRAVRAVAKKADLVDPVTGAPSTARAVSRAFDWVDKKSDETLFRGLPKEEGLLSERDIGVLEGSIGSQVLLALIDVEEVQLALKALGAIGSVESVVAAIQANPDHWQSDPKFWLEVINLALFMIGIGTSATGRKIATILVDSASTLMTTLPAAVKLADDYVHATGSDRDQRLRDDIKVLIKALAQAIQQIIMHAKGAKRGAAGAPEGSPASPEPATGPKISASAPVPAAEPAPVSAPAAEPAPLPVPAPEPAPAAAPAPPAPAAAKAPASRAGPRDVRQAIRDAKASGIQVDLEVQAHRVAPDVRAEKGLTGADVESAHIAPTSALRDTAGYVRGEALTTLLSKDTHRAFDRQWKAVFEGMASSGRTEMTVQELYSHVAEAIRNLPDERTDRPIITARQKGTMEFLLHRELYSELGLKPDDKVRMPYTK